MVWMENQTNHIFSSQILVPSKALAFFGSVKAERGADAAEEKLETNRACSVGLRDRSLCFPSHKSASEAAAADV